MTDLIFSGKRPRVPSFCDKHLDYSENHVPIGGSDSLLEKKIPQAEVKNFLDICRFCKKNLRHDEDIFMYGYFGAFCTKQCRTNQMTIDSFIEKLQEKVVAKKVRSGTEPEESSKDDYLVNPKKMEKPRFFI